MDTTRAYRALHTLDGNYGILGVSWCSDNVTSSNAQYGLFPDGSRRIGGANRQKQCKMCRKWIDLGNSKSSDNALINHEGKSCRPATVHENKLEQERHAVAVVLENLGQTTSLSLCMPYRPKQFPPSPCLPLSPLSFVSGSSLSMWVVIISNVFLFFMCLPSWKIDKHTHGWVSWHPAGMGRWSIGYLHEVPVVSSCNQGQLSGFPVSNSELWWQKDYWIWYMLDYLYGRSRSMLPVPKTYTKDWKPPTAITTASGTTQLPVSYTRPINAKPSNEEPDYTNPWNYGMSILSIFYCCSDNNIYR